MPAAVIIPIITFCAFAAVICGNHYLVAKILRVFIKPIGRTDEYFLSRVRVIKDLDYRSVFGGTLDIYTSPNAKKQAVLVWIHGGGFVGGDKSFVKNWASAIAYRGDIAVVAVNYRLAPEWHYPTPIIQIGEALEYLTANAEKLNLDTGKIFLGGDSAGSQIASQYAALVYNSSLRANMNIVPSIARNQLKGIVLCCGFYNMDTVLKSRFPAIGAFTRAYTGLKKASRYERRNELSTVKNLNEGYCETFITCGRSDPFWSQSCEMIDALQSRGISVDFYLPQGRVRVGHEFQFKTHLAEADDAISKTVEFIERRK